MRKRKPKLRVIAPDPRYSDPMVTQFVNNLMWEGKKSTSYDVFYNAMDLVGQRVSAEDAHAIGTKAAASEVLHSRFQQKFVQNAKFLLA